MVVSREEGEVTGPVECQEQVELAHVDPDGVAPQGREDVAMGTV